MRSFSGSTSSSQATTATALNSSPLARCIVLIDTEAASVFRMSVECGRRQER
jgi:hypothetical protein